VEVLDVAIIGAGPAGVSAAIQLKRYGLEPALFEKEEVGGLLRNAHWVENYPGFPEGISGCQLAKLFQKQAEKSGVGVYFEEVLKLDYKNEMFFVTTNQRDITSRIAIIASGTKPRNLSIPIASAEIERRIFYEIYPLVQVANEKIAIIGSGDIAFDYALNLCSKGNEVTILNRGEKVKCLPLLWERVKKCEKFRYQKNTQITKIEYRDQALTLICDNPQSEYEIYVQSLVVAIGREPALDFLSENLHRNLENLRDAHVLHMIGDVKNDIYRQTAICVGDGIKSAMMTYKKIVEEDLCK
jgi:thioredoxin reductase (NADPH)